MKYNENVSLSEENRIGLGIYNERLASTLDEMLCQRYVDDKYYIGQGPRRINIEPDGEVALYFKPWCESCDKDRARRCLAVFLLNYVKRSLGVISGTLAEMKTLKEFDDCAKPPFDVMLCAQNKFPGYPTTFVEKTTYREIAFLGEFLNGKRPRDLFEEYGETWSKEMIGRPTDEMTMNVLNVYQREFIRLESELKQKQKEMKIRHQKEEEDLEAQYIEMLQVLDNKINEARKTLACG